MKATLLLGLAVFFLLGPRPYSAQRPAWAKHAREIKLANGIPIIPDVPKDAIPPLNAPAYVSSAAATWLGDNDVVLGVALNGDARAYPIKILNWHEIVHERVGGKEMLITYCPLCRSGIVFDRRLDGRLLSFGNTGALYESDMVMYDRQTGSSWFQVAGKAITGPLKGKTLSVLPSYLTTWKEWRTLYPSTKVLSRNTGYRRNYARDSFRGYDALNSPPGFPVSRQDDRLPPKTTVLGLLVNGVAKAYPVRLLRGKTVCDELNGRQLELIGDAAGRSAQVFFVQGARRTPAPVVAAFWFSWSSAHPDTLIFRQR